MKRLVNFSDLTGEPIDSDIHVAVRVLEATGIPQPVLLDASEPELVGLVDLTADLVILELQRPSGASERRIVKRETFEKLFTVDVAEALAGAEQVADKPGRRDKASLDKIRTWARANGWAELSSRGRVPVEIETAYAKAHMS